MKKLFITTAMIVGMLLLVYTPAHSHNEYELLELTDSPYMDYAPKINDAGQVVWQGGDGTDFEIFLFDGTLIKPLESDSYSDELPNLNNKGHVVWQGYDGTDYEIFLYDGTNVVKLTANESNDLYPNINDAGQIVWVHFDPLTSMFSIILRQPDGTQLIIGTMYDFCHYWPTPLINAVGQVAWVAHDGVDYEMYFYNGVNTIQLTNNTSSDCNPSLNNKGMLVWQDQVDGMFQIFMYDGTNVVQVTSDPLTNFTSPKINDAGQIAWQGTNGSIYGIYLYTAGTVKTLAEQNLFAGGIQLSSSGKVIWQSWTGTNDDLYLYEGTLPPKNITNSNYTDRAPQINGRGDIVWFCFEGYETEILLALAVTPSELMRRLEAHVVALLLNKYPQMLLTNEIRLALHFTEHGRPGFAVKVLEAFKQLVARKSGSGIEPADAAALTEETDKIINLLKLNIEEANEPH
jgi:hypothetical protein